MGAGRKTTTINVQENIGRSNMPENGSFSMRNMPKKDLRGVIFGCTHDTMTECLSRQLFGLPYWHSYVQNIGVGLPLFLFNYSERKLYGIFEAASNGQLYLDVAAWTDGGSERTPYPAQVRFRTKIQCQPLVESQFKKIIEKNYFMPNHFWFELDHAQTKALTALFKPSYPHANSVLPPVAFKEKKDILSLPTASNATSWKDVVCKKEPVPAVTTWKDVVNNECRNKFESIRDDGESENHGSMETLPNDLKDTESKESVSDWEDLVEDNVQNISSGSSAWSDGANHSAEEQQYANEALESENRMFQFTSSSNGCTDDGMVGFSPRDKFENSGNALDNMPVSAKKEDCFASENNQENVQGMESSYGSCFNGNTEIVECLNASDSNRGDIELVQFVKELKEWAEDLKKQQVESDREIQQLRNQLWYSDRKIGFLEDRVKELELKTDPSKLVDESLEKYVEQYLGSEDVIYLIGGFDGCSWLSSLDCFSPALDIITPLKSMNSARPYASSVALDGNIFVFGGSIGRAWFNTVEYYNRRDDEWISCPSMLRKKGSLSGAILNGKIFAIGGGDGVQSFSEVETFDPPIGKWIANQPMHYKRFASAATELKGVIYAVGGYDGVEYLRSAERFDPRQGYWTKLPAMSTRRASHSLAVLNENLYCIGGYDGQKMVSSVEIFDPRQNSWTMGEPMKFQRGYASAAVLGNSLFSIGGIDDEKEIVDIVECYKEGTEWSSCSWKSIGKRSFCSAIVL